MPPESTPMPASTPAPGPDPRHAGRVRAARATHWRRTRRLTIVLMALWLGTGFCTVFFARELSSLTVFGWPLSFYMAAQGASLVCLAIIGAYAWRMRRYDRDYGRAMADASGDAP
ncbi:DUF4212 domain-containing protein [Massilia niabensis]|uniref:DUF4212 domain-containing protein n=1 Tax=Massilia niabensis TaxID=544910 RepID=A0ABW0L3Y1_9BURK